MPGRTMYKVEEELVSLLNMLKKYNLPLETSTLLVLLAEGNDSGRKIRDMEDGIASILMKDAKIQSV